MKFAGKSLATQLHDGSTLRNISVAVKSFTAPNTADTHEVTGGGSTNKSYVVGLVDQNPTLEGFVDDQANGQHAVMSTIQSGTAGYELRLGPKGTASGLIQYKGTALQSSYEVTADVNGSVDYTAEYVPFDNQIGFVWGTV